MRPRGFTLIELLVVLAIVGALLAVAGPRLSGQVDRSREAVLRHNLQALRVAIDQFYADRARYPVDLQELVRLRYLRAMPVDPVTERTDTWKPVMTQGRDPGVIDVRSGAEGAARDGSLYEIW